MNDRALRRARLHSQLLLPSRAKRSVDEVVRAQYAIQAQDQTAAALAIRARSADLTIDDISAAVTSRSLVFTWSLRGTLHFHHADDVRPLLGLLRPLARGNPGRRRTLGIDGERGERAARALRDALAARGPMSRVEISEHLAQHGVDSTGQAAVHVMQRAALEGVLCIVPRPRQRALYALLDDWVPRGRSEHPDRAMAQLARRFVDGHGPVVPADFAVWTGLGIGFARRAWTLIHRDLEEITTARGSMWILRGSAPSLHRALDAPAPLRLLGAFENWLLAYADRSFTATAERMRAVNDGGGMLKPMLVAGGELVGTGRIRRVGERLRISASPLQRLSSTSMADLAREVDDVGRFLRAEVLMNYGTGH